MFERQEQSIEAVTEREERETELRTEGEKIYTEEFTSKLDKVLGHQFRGERRERIVLAEVIDKHLGYFSAGGHTAKSLKEQSVLQLRLIKDLAGQISRIPFDAWSINFRQAVENNTLNCSNCATLIGLILERVQKRVGLQGVEYGNAYSHGMNIVTLADGRVFYLDSRNNVVKDLELNKNTKVEDWEGLKIYKIAQLKGGMNYKIIPAQSIKAGAMGVYLGNLLCAYEHEYEHEVPNAIKMWPNKEQRRFIEGARRVYTEEGLSDEKKRQHLREIAEIFERKVSEYKKSPEFKNEIQRKEAGR